ncbi:hypothetical protein XBKB1_1420051 [Xenorhabdus bovienii str. kraussei Becker Underwood]|uniref:Uncharacterized protein n=1 Tax=Xenorhabdus bovienii str. kraussei Becker Underwood TaxID=1398204 RepID=A0A077PR16_XENBV|nr:hypothetical protein XBKB1_1420051 [Xenorhabdus bovienii str. kraussei Becker Underwood]
MEVMAIIELSPNDPHSITHAEVQPG